jgi:hypothetical protein
VHHPCDNSNVTQPITVSGDLDTAITCNRSG